MWWSEGAREVTMLHPFRKVPAGPSFFAGCTSADRVRTGKIRAVLVWALCIAGITFPASAPGATSQYLAIVNMNGADTGAPQSSGTLPCAQRLGDRQGLRTTGAGTLPQRIDRVLPRVSPADYDRDSARFLQRALFPRTAAVGDQREFWVRDEQDRDWRRVSATVEALGSRCAVYVDDTLSLSADTTATLATEFDVMYAVVGGTIGEFVDFDGSGTVAVLVYDMHDSGAVSGFVGGYFWSKDYYDDTYTQSQDIRSNETDMIYIRGDEPSGWGVTGIDFFQYNLTTLVHEYQHLVHFGIKVWQTQNAYGASDVWIDEMMAMASETMYFKEKLDEDAGFTHPAMTGDGYLAGRIGYYNADSTGSIRNGHGLTDWGGGGYLLASYSLAYLFGQYLALQSSDGQRVFGRIIDVMLQQGWNDYRAVARAAAETLSGVSDWEDLLQNWALANVLNHSAGPYGYGGAFTLSPGSPDRDPALLYNGGVVYCSPGGQWDEPSDAGATVRYIGFDDSGPVTAGTSTIPASTTTTSTALVSTTMSSTSAPATTTSTTADATTTTTVPLTSTTTTSIAISLTTTTTTMAVSCPAEVALAGVPGACDLLRCVRDHVLTRGPAGARLVERYYAVAGDLAAMLRDDPHLRLQVRRTLVRLLPAFQRVCAGGDFRLSPTERAAAAELAGRIAAAALPEAPAVARSVQRMVILTSEADLF